MAQNTNYEQYLQNRNSTPGSGPQAAAAGSAAPEHSQPDTGASASFDDPARTAAFAGGTETNPDGRSAAGSASTAAYSRSSQPENGTSSEEAAPRRRGKNSDLYDMSDHELLVELVRQQRKDTKHQTRVSWAAWIIAVILLVVSVILVPRVVFTLRNLNETMQNVVQTSTQLQTTLTGIDSVVDNVNSLVEDNTEYVNEAVRKLNSIDFEGLNESIQSLNDIVEPLASLFRH